MEERVYVVAQRRTKLVCRELVRAFFQVPERRVVNDLRTAAIGINLPAAPFVSLAMPQMRKTSSNFGGIRRRPTFGLPFASSVDVQIIGQHNLKRRRCQSSAGISLAAKFAFGLAMVLEIFSPTKRSYVRRHE